MPRHFYNCIKIGHFASRCPTREPKVKRRPYKSEFPKECLYLSDDEIEIKDINFMDSDDEDEFGFFIIKEEKLHILHIEKNKIDWIIDSGCFLEREI